MPEISTTMKVTRAKAPVTMKFPLAAEPKGTSPKKFMARMKKNSVRIYPV